MIIHIVLVKELLDVVDGSMMTPSGPITVVILVCEYGLYM